jgi:hypothetical protein
MFHNSESVRPGRSLGDLAAAPTLSILLFKFSTLLDFDHLIKALQIFDGANPSSVVTLFYSVFDSIFLTTHQLFCLFQFIDVQVDFYHQQLFMPS